MSFSPGWGGTRVRGQEPGSGAQGTPSRRSQPLCLAPHQPPARGLFRQSEWTSLPRTTSTSSPRFILPRWVSCSKSSVISSSEAALYYLRFLILVNMQLHACKVEFYFPLSSIVPSFHHNGHKDSYMRFVLLKTNNHNKICYLKEDTQYALATYSGT